MYVLTHHGKTIKLWKLIDWRGKAEIKVEKSADELEISKYFKSISQSIKTSSHPIVNDKLADLDSYNVFIPILDNAPIMEELEKALNQIGSGVSIDGISSGVAKILPPAMKEVIILMIQKVFFLIILVNGASKYYIQLKKRDMHRMILSYVGSR